jgi:predicted transcriptional regulator
MAHPIMAMRCCRWLSGVLRLCYRLTAIEALCYGSIISATDPVRTQDLAITRETAELHSSMYYVCQTHAKHKVTRGGIQ